MNPAALAAALRGDVENTIAAATPDGIERQEKAGQIALVKSADMPMKMSPSREAFEAVGFNFGEPIDDVFLSANLPAGWVRRATDHSMWSEIVDDAGRVRVSVFYKAAFYDRRAHATLSERYKIDSYSEVSPGIYAVSVTDGGKEIHRFGEYPRGDYKIAEPLEAQARIWLKERFPNYADPTAYWSGQ